MGREEVVMEGTTETRPIRVVILQPSNVGPGEQLCSRDGTLVAALTFYLDYMAVAFIWDITGSSPFAPEGL